MKTEDWKDIKVVLKFKDINATTVVTMREIVANCGDDITIIEAYEILKKLQKKYNMEVSILTKKNSDIFKVKKYI